MSVTERELEAGIMKIENPTSSCFWFKRTFTDIESAARSNRMPRFMGNTLPFITTC